MTRFSYFRCTPGDGGRSLAVTDPDGAPVVRLDLGVPGAPVPGWVGDDEEVLSTAGDEWEARLRYFADIESTSVHLSLDNRAAVERDTPAKQWTSRWFTSER